MRIEKDQIRSVIILLAMAAGFYFVGWRPQQAERAELNARVQNTQEQLGVNRQGVSNLSELRRLVEQMSEQALTSHEAVPTSTELADLLRSLTNELQTQRMIEPEIETEAIIAGEDFNVIPLSLHFRGSFEGLAGFLRKVESLPRLIRIHKLHIDAAPTKPGEPIEVSLQMTTFSTFETSKKP